MAKYQELKRHSAKAFENKVDLVHSFAYYLFSRLIGGLVYHNNAIRPFGFFFPGAKFFSDTNSNLECLRRILDSMAGLPKTLQIQMDNTCKDNKNWFFLLSWHISS
jgi:hypothetical protein